MDKLEYISRQLAKAESKKYEHYVISRIWHLLDDTSLKFVTQQYVSRPEGRAMTDMYFPQVKLHIEIDEGFHKKQIQQDKVRELDIINATGHEILRVDVTKPIDDINYRIADIIQVIKDKKAQNKDFKHWDIVAEQNPMTYIEKGYITLEDDCAFRTMVDTVCCFGRKYNEKGIWRGGVKHPKESDKIIWFPKLYKNGQWNNSISNDETIIHEINEDLDEAKKHITHTLTQSNIRRIVFARVKSPLGDIMYRYKGQYFLDTQSTSIENGLVWRRESEKVNTYKFTEK